MDVASLAMSLSQVKMGTQIGNAVLSKTLDNNEVLGQNLAQMIDAASMERSVIPTVGSQFDLKI